MSARIAFAAKIRNFIRRSHPAWLCVTLLGSATAAWPQAAQTHTMSDDHAPAKLVQIVHDATKKYINVNNARAAGYAPFLGCVTGPDQGAMGVHYVNGKLLNGTLYPDQPQALIYEPEREWFAAGGRGVHRGRRDMAEQSQPDAAGAGGSGAATGSCPEPVQSALVL